MPIFLIGYMCAGKTTLGAPLARALDFDFIDLDDMIEAKAGMSVSEIFATKGEAAFRAIERECLRQVCILDDAVVACGGGTPCQPGLMEMMNGTGTTVWLRPSQQRLIARLMAGKGKRPLIAGIDTEAEMADFAGRMMLGREPWYAMAQHVFDSSMLENEEEIQQSINQFISQICPTLADSHQSQKNK